MSDRVDALVRAATPLPNRLMDQLTVAARGGPASVTSLRSASGSGPLRSTCTALLAAMADRSHLELAGLLDGLRRARRQAAPCVDVVWSGPSSGVTVHRLTSAAVADLIDEANTEIVLVSYAMHSEPSVAAALGRAADRSVEITLLAERAADNPKFDGGLLAFPDVPAVRLAWPASCREPGAALHAKILAIDGATVLIGSANLTQSALHRNLECGVVIRDVAVGQAVVTHLGSLRHYGTLVRLPL